MRAAAVTDRTRRSFHADTTVRHFVRRRFRARRTGAPGWTGKIPLPSTTRVTRFREVSARAHVRERRAGRGGSVTRSKRRRRDLVRRMRDRDRAFFPSVPRPDNDCVARARTALDETGRPPMTASDGRTADPQRRPVGLDVLCSLNAVVVVVVVVVTVSSRATAYGCSVFLRVNGRRRGRVVGHGPSARAP